MVYQSKLPCVTLMYVEGVLHTILIDKDDTVLFDGLKHHITLYEEDLSTDYFTQTNEIPS